jgi:hypothetical protein
MGQSNIPAGATIGSNHNSRGADGEVIAGRGFWPGLCVSLKHNSRFASFTILAKGDYAHELNIPVPFSLVSIDLSKDQLVVMPAYWFMYNLYALARNSWKYADRDKRKERIQNLENDFLAPDSINEMFYSLQLLEIFVGKAYHKKEKPGRLLSNDEYRKTGKGLLEEKNEVIQQLEIVAEGLENSKRKTIIIKVQQAYDLFKEMILYYGATQLIQFIIENEIKTISILSDSLSAKTNRNEWLNVGGQLIPLENVDNMKAEIKEGKIKSWDQLHDLYQQLGNQYPQQKFQHALASLSELKCMDLKKITEDKLNEMLDKAVETKEMITKQIYQSRAKDYSNTYRKMVYDTEEEMNKVLGKLNDNNFICQQQEELKTFKGQIENVKKRFKMK